MYLKKVKNVFEKGSKRESCAPKPCYILGKPLYVQRFAPTEKPLYKEPHSHGPDFASKRMLAGNLELFLRIFKDSQKLMFSLADGQDMIIDPPYRQPVSVTATE